MRTRCPFVIASLLAACGSAASAQSIDWLNAIDGNWNDSANWAGGNIPNLNTEIAVLGLSGAYTAFVTNNFTIGGLDITNPNATVSIGANQLTISGNTNNSGTVLVNTNGSTFNGSVFVNVDATLGGNGSMLLNGIGQANDAALNVQGGSTLTHAASHTIEGGGQISGMILNNGTVVANLPASVGLHLNGTLDQSGGGSAGADNGTLVLGSNGVTIGGELFSLNGGEIVTGGNNHILRGVMVSGNLIVPSSRFLVIDGTFENNGSIEINPELNVFNGTLRFDSSSAVLGSGEILLFSTGDINDARLQTQNGSIVTIGSAQTVQGSGSIDASTGGQFINQGTINANDPANVLALAGDHIGDGGVYRADGGELNLRTNMTISNAVFETSGDGRVELDISGSAMISDSTNLGTIIARGNGGELNIEGSIVNNGVIRINPEDNVFNVGVRTMTGATISGSGTIEMTASSQPADAQLDATNGGTLTIGSGQVVMGSGSIDGVIGTGSLVVNLGTINGNHAATMDDPARPMQLNGFHDGMNVGVYRADEGILNIDNNADVRNAIFDSSGAGFVGMTHSGTSTIANVTNLGSFDILGNGNSLILAGDLTNNGTVRINSDVNVFNTLVRADANVAIDGSGEVRMFTAGNLNDADLRAADGFTLTIGNAQTVSGSGRIEGVGTGVVNNDGVINGNDPLYELRLAGNHNGAGGGMYRADNGTLGLGNDLNLSGGTFDSSGTGAVVKVDSGTSNIANIVNLGTMNLLGSGNAVEVAGTFVNEGEININSDNNIFDTTLRFIEDVTVTGTGAINMLTPGNSNDARIATSEGVTATLSQGQSISGEGAINGSFIIEGEIDPGGTLRLFTTDDITLVDSSHTIFDLGGDAAPNFDRFSVRNGRSITLDGTATINLETGYSPSFGDTWDVISGATTGTFDEVVTGIAPPGQVYRVIYETSRVYVILTCDADLSGDGVIDFFDVSEFLSYFSSQDVRGDLNNDGAFDFFDVSVFLQLYSQGCNP